ncbi:MAG: DUF6577 family protein [Bacteroidota bacterium]
MPKIIENRLIEEFKNRDIFTREELFDFFRYFEPDLKEATLAWRIYDLKNKNIIKVLQRGLYTISCQAKYKPNLSSELLKVSKKITEKYEDVKYCIWDTVWLNEFSRHQTSKKFLIIEIEKDFVESLYYHLKDNFNFDLYINPDEKLIEFYISESKYPIIIKKLITRSPIDKITQNKTKLAIPLLEKILVDIYSEKKLYYFYQGSELRYIYENALSNYSINYTKLLSYARRREKEIEIKSYLVNNMGHLIKDILND